MPIAAIRIRSGQYGFGLTTGSRHATINRSAAAFDSCLVWLGIMDHPSDIPDQPRCAHDMRAEDPSQKPKIDDSRRALRILVVDDFVDAADGLAIYLARHGHAVRTAHDGFAALAAAADFAPQVILLDIGLPKLDGYRVAGQIRQQVALQNACLIAVTGYGQAKDMRAAHDAGFDHFLLKPINPAELLAILESLPTAAIE
jgi:CheY-like chemotaxis protein